MRTRRNDRIGPTQADHLVAGDPPHPRHRGLGDLLDAAKAPGTSRELAGEQAVVAAFSAAYTRAAATKGKDRARVRRSARRVVVTTTTSLALLALTGTAVTARAGSLPDHAQQHAHRLFSALGVPAPRTGPTNPVTRPKPSTRPSAPAKSPSAPAIIALDWCDTWHAQPSGKALDPETRRRLTEAAGGEKKIEKYCIGLTASASAPATRPPSTSPPAPSATPSAPGPSSATPPAPGPPSAVPPGKPSRIPPGHSGDHPTPPVPTPSHPKKK